MNDYYAETKAETIFVAQVADHEEELNETVSQVESKKRLNQMVQNASNCTLGNLEDDDGAAGEEPIRSFRSGSLPELPTKDMGEESFRKFSVV